MPGLGLLRLKFPIQSFADNVYSINTGDIKMNVVFPEHKDSKSHKGDG